MRTAAALAASAAHIYIYHDAFLATEVTAAPVKTGQVGSSSLETRTVNNNTLAGTGNLATWLWLSGRRSKLVSSSTCRAVLRNCNALANK